MSPPALPFRLIPAIIVAVFFLLAPNVVAQEALVLPLHGPIGRFQAVMVQRAIVRAQSEGFTHLVIDIDTFGGRVDSALEIAGALGTAGDVTTVAFVGNSESGRGVSWSAGALIAFATQEIYLAPGTSIGAAAPVLQGPQGQEGADEKTVSAVRGHMAALAERNGHPPEVARAMVDVSVQLEAVETDDGIRLLSTEAADALVERNEQAVRSRETVSPEGKLLTLTAGEMERYGISRGSPPDRNALMDDLDVDGFTVLEPTGGDQLVATLTSAGMTSLLVLAGLVALFLEITSPGFGVPGAVALTAFATLFASNIMLGRAGSLEIILFVLGVGLVIFELFVIPGFGVAGVSGLASIALSLILALQRFVIPEFDYQWEILGRNVLVVLGSAVVSIVAALSATMLIKNTRLFSRLALETDQNTSLGYTVQSPDTSDRYLHRTATTTTALRPAGKIDVDGEVIPAESEGGYIESNCTVTVVRVDGNRIVVREV